MTRLTASVTDSAVKKLATVRARRYLTATVKIVIDRSIRSGPPSY